MIQEKFIIIVSMMIRTKIVIVIFEKIKKIQFPKIMRSLKKQTRYSKLRTVING